MEGNGVVKSRRAAIMTFKQTNEKVEYVRDARGDNMGVRWKTSPDYRIKWDGMGWDGMDGWMGLDGVDGWVGGWV